MCSCALTILKIIANIINVILLILGIVITIFGAIVMNTDMEQFSDNVKSMLPSEVGDKAPPIPDVFPIIGKLVLAIGIFIICMALLGIFAFTCCSRFKCFLIIYLVILSIVTIIQISVVSLVFSTQMIKDQISSVVKPIFTDPKQHEQDEHFVLGTEIFYRCCGWENGAKDFYCSGIYDAYCNFGCKQNITMKTQLPICPAKLRNPVNDKSADCLKKNAASFVNVEPYYADIEGLPPKYYTPKDAKYPAKVPTDMPACAEFFYDDLDENITNLQIISVIILVFEVFEIFLALLIICQNKKADAVKSFSGSDT